MHLMYVDESGDYGFSSNNVYPNGSTPTQFFIRSALIIHDWKWQLIKNKIENIKYKWKIPADIEIHATEILNGYIKKHNKKTHKREQYPNWFGLNFPLRTDRVKFLLEICQLVSTLDVTILCVVIDKSKIIRSNPRYKDIPKENSWEYLIERMNLFLHVQSDQRGMIISDAIEHKIEAEHRDFAKALLSQSLHIHNYHFIESILFEPSDSSLLIQLADIVSYAIHRKYNMNDFSFYNLLQNKIYRHNGSVLGAGLKIWP